MERAQIFVIVAVMAAVGLFGLRLLNSDPVPEEEILGGATARQPDPGSLEGDLASGGESKGGERASGSRPSGSSRLAHTALDRRENRGESHIPGATNASRSGTSGAPLADSAIPHLEQNKPRRAELVELLASQQDSAGAARSDQSVDEIALEVNRTEDTAPAIERKDINAPESSGDGLTFTEDSVLAFPDGGNASSEAGTISFQIEPHWGGADETNNSLVTLRGANMWQNRIELVKNGRYLRFILSDDSGREADISIPIDNWEAGQAHDIQATWGDSRTSLFIDGRLVGQNSYERFVRPQGAPLYLGSDHRGSTYSGANGTIRNFKVTTNASHLDG